MGERVGQTEGCAPSPLTGAYLLVILPQPHLPEHKDAVLHSITKGFLSWDKEDCHVDLEKELQIITAQAPEGEEARNGERLIQFASENLVTEVLIHPQLNTVVQCIRNLLSSFTRHRHIIHAGYTYVGNGSWILQDGTFSYADFVDMFQEMEVQRVLRAYENTVTIDVHCCADGGWSVLKAAPHTFSKLCRIRLSPDDKLTSGEAIHQFLDYLAQYLVPASLENLLQPSDVVGNIRFSHPTLYVFPGGQGDAALFGINGFNMLVDGGFSRKACFWDFIRHLDRLDAVLMTRLNNGNLQGIASLLYRKRLAAVYPQIGHFFCNLQERRQPSPDGDKDKDPLSVNLIDQGQEIVSSLKQLNLKPQVCYREMSLEPINLYHKVGHGKLDMYVLSPAKDSREVKEFLTRWNASDAKLFASQSKKPDFHFPLYNRTSICALLVWQPANPNDNITRLLFPGSAPQEKIFEGLDRLKNLEFMRHAVCSAKSLSPSSSTVGLNMRQPLTRPKGPSVIEKLPPSEIRQMSKPIEPYRPPTKTEPQEPKPFKATKQPKPPKAPREKIEPDNTVAQDKLKSQESAPKKAEKPKADKPKKIIQRHEKKQQQKPAEKKEDSIKSSPTTPKKTAMNGDAKHHRASSRTRVSPSATPAKSAKEENNRKVLESKAKEAARRSVPAKKEDAKKIEKRTISKRPQQHTSPSKPIGKQSSPIKAVPHARDKARKVSKTDKELTTDSSTVSTPSTVDAELGTAVKPKDIPEKEKPKLPEEAKKEVAVIEKGVEDETAQDEAGIISKEEEDEILIIEKVEVPEEEGGRDKIEMHLVTEEAAPKVETRKEDVESAEEEKIIDSAEKDEKSKEVVSPESDLVHAKPQEEQRPQVGAKERPPLREKSQDLLDQKIDESQPDERFSTTIESGATTAPTLPEDERIPLDEIKEGIEEKHVKEKTKEKEEEHPQKPEQPTSLPQVAVIPGTVFDQKSQLLRDIVKTPDEVADLPVHEEADAGIYERGSKEDLLALPTPARRHEEPPREEAVEATEELKFIKDGLEKEDTNKDLKEELGEARQLAHVEDSLKEGGKTAAVDKEEIKKEPEILKPEEIVVAQPEEIETAEVKELEEKMEKEEVALKKDQKEFQELKAQLERRKSDQEVGEGEKKAEIPAVEPEEPADESGKKPAKQEEDKVEVKTEAPLKLDPTLDLEAKEKIDTKEGLKKEEESVAPPKEISKEEEKKLDEKVEARTKSPTETKEIPSLSVKEEEKDAALKVEKVDDIVKPPLQAPQEEEKTLSEKKASLEGEGPQDEKAEIDLATKDVTTKEIKQEHLQADLQHTPPPAKDDKTEQLVCAVAMDTGVPGEEKEALPKDIIKPDTEVSVIQKEITEVPKGKDEVATEEVEGQPPVPEEGDKQLKEDIVPKKKEAKEALILDEEEYLEEEDIATTAGLQLKEKDRSPVKDETDKVEVEQKPEIKTDDQVGEKPSELLPKDEAHEIVHSQGETVHKETKPEAEVDLTKPDKIKREEPEEEVSSIDAAKTPAPKVVDEVKTQKALEPVEVESAPEEKVIHSWEEGIDRKEVDKIKLLTRGMEKLDSEMELLRDHFKAEEAHGDKYVPTGDKEKDVFEPKLEAKKIEAAIILPEDFLGKKESLEQKVVSKKPDEETTKVEEHEPSIGTKPVDKKPEVEEDIEKPQITDVSIKEKDIKEKPDEILARDISLPPIKDEKPQDQEKIEIPTSSIKPEIKDTLLKDEKIDDTKKVPEFDAKTVELVKETVKIEKELLGKDELTEDIPTEHAQEVSEEMFGAATGMEELPKLDEKEVKQEDIDKKSEEIKKEIIPVLSGEEIGKDDSADFPCEEEPQITLPCDLSRLEIFKKMGPKKEIGHELPTAEKQQDEPPTKEETTPVAPTDLKLTEGKKKDQKISPADRELIEAVAVEELEKVFTMAEAIQKKDSLPKEEVEKAEIEKSEKVPASPQDLVRKDDEAEVATLKKEKVPEKLEESEDKDKGIAPEAIIKPDEVPDRKKSVEDLIKTVPSTESEEVRPVEKLSSEEISKTEPVGDDSIKMQEEVQAKKDEPSQADSVESVAGSDDSTESKVKDDKLKEGSDAIDKKAVEVTESADLAKEKPELKEEPIKEEKKEMAQEVKKPEEAVKIGKEEVKMVDKDVSEDVILTSALEEKLVAANERLEEVVMLKEDEAKKEITPPTPTPSPEAEEVEVTQKEEVMKGDEMKKQATPPTSSPLPDLEDIKRQESPLAFSDVPGQKDIEILDTEPKAKEVQEKKEKTPPASSPFPDDDISKVSADDGVILKPEDKGESLAASSPLPEPHVASKEDKPKIEEVKTKEETPPSVSPLPEAKGSPIPPEKEVAPTLEKEMQKDDVSQLPESSEKKDETGVKEKIDTAEGITPPTISQSGEEKEPVVKEGKEKEDLPKSTSPEIKEEPIATETDSSKKTSPAVSPLPDEKVDGSKKEDAKKVEEMPVAMPEAAPEHKSADEFKGPDFEKASLKDDEAVTKISPAPTPVPKPVEEKVAGGKVELEQKRESTPSPSPPTSDIKEGADKEIIDQDDSQKLTKVASPPPSSPLPESKPAEPKDAILKVETAPTTKEEPFKKETTPEQPSPLPSEKDVVPKSGEIAVPPSPSPDEKHVDKEETTLLAKEVEAKQEKTPPASSPLPDDKAVDVLLADQTVTEERDEGVVRPPTSSPLPSDLTQKDAEEKSPPLSVGEEAVEVCEDLPKPTEEPTQVSQKLTEKPAELIVHSISKDLEPAESLKEMLHKETKEKDDRDDDESHIEKGEEAKLTETIAKCAEAGPAKQEDIEHPPKATTTEIDKVEKETEYKDKSDIAVSKYIIDIESKEHSDIKKGLELPIEEVAGKTVEEKVTHLTNGHHEPELMIAKGKSEGSLEIAKDLKDSKTESEEKFRDKEGLSEIPTKLDVIDKDKDRGVVEITKDLDEKKDATKTEPKDKDLEKDKFLAETSGKGFEAPDEGPSFKPEGKSLPIKAVSQDSGISQDEISIEDRFKEITAEEKEVAMDGSKSKEGPPADTKGLATLEKITTTHEKELSETVGSIICTETTTVTTSKVTSTPEDSQTVKGEDKPSEAPVDSTLPTASASMGGDQTIISTADVIGHAAKDATSFIMQAPESAAESKEKDASKTPSPLEKYEDTKTVTTLIDQEAARETKTTPEAKTTIGIDADSISPKMPDEPLSQAQSSPDSKASLSPVSKISPKSEETEAGSAEMPSEKVEEMPSTQVPKIKKEDENRMGSVTIAKIEHSVLTEDIHESSKQSEETTVTTTKISIAHEDKDQKLDKGKDDFPLPKPTFLEDDKGTIKVVDDDEHLPTGKPFEATKITTMETESDEVTQEASPQTSIGLQEPTVPSMIIKDKTSPEHDVIPSSDEKSKTTVDTTITKKASDEDLKTVGGKAEQGPMAQPVFPEDEKTITKTEHDAPPLSDDKSKTTTVTTVTTETSVVGEEVPHEKTVGAKPKEDPMGQSLLFDGEKTTKTESEVPLLSDDKSKITTVITVTTKTSVVEGEEDLRTVDGKAREDPMTQSILLEDTKTLPKPSSSDVDSKTAEVITVTAKASVLGEDVDQKFVDGKAKDDLMAKSMFFEDQKTITKTEHYDPLLSEDESKSTTVTTVTTKTIVIGEEDDQKAVGGKAKEDLPAAPVVLEDAKSLPKADHDAPSVSDDMFKKTAVITTKASVIGGDVDLKTVDGKAKEDPMTQSMFFEEVKTTTKTEHHAPSLSDDKSKSTTVTTVTTKTSVIGAQDDQKTVDGKAKEDPVTQSMFFEEEKTTTKTEHHAPSLSDDKSESTTVTTVTTKTSIIGAQDDQKTVDGKAKEDPMAQTTLVEDEKTTTKTDHDVPSLSDDKTKETTSIAVTAKSSVTGVDVDLKSVDGKAKEDPMTQSMYFEDEKTTTKTEHHALSLSDDKSTTTTVTTVTTKTSLIGTHDDQKTIGGKPKEDPMVQSAFLGDEKITTMTEHHEPSFSDGESETTTVIAATTKASVIDGGEYIKTVDGKAKDDPMAQSMFFDDEKTITKTEYDVSSISDDRSRTTTLTTVTTKTFVTEKEDDQKTVVGKAKEDPMVQSALLDETGHGALSDKKSEKITETLVTTETSVVAIGEDSITASSILKDDPLGHSIVLDDKFGTRQETLPLAQSKPDVTTVVTTTSSTTTDTKEKPISQALPEHGTKFDTSFEASGTPGSGDPKLVSKFFKDGKMVSTTDTFPTTDTQYKITTTMSYERPDSTSGKAKDDLMTRSMLLEDTKSLIKDVHDSHVSTEKSVTTTWGGDVGDTMGSRTKEDPMTQSTFFEEISTPKSSTTKTTVTTTVTTSKEDPMSQSVIFEKVATVTKIDEKDTLKKQMDERDTAKSEIIGDLKSRGDEETIGVSSIVAELRREQSSRSATPAGSDPALSEREYEPGQWTPHSDTSSGQVSRAATHMYESSQRYGDESDEEETPGSPMSTTSHLHSPPRFDYGKDSMTGSFYGALPEDDPKSKAASVLSSMYVTRYEEKDSKDSSSSSAPEALSSALQRDVDLPKMDVDFKTALEEHKAARGEDPTAKKDPVESWGKPLGLPPPPHDPFQQWGQPLGLPSPAPPPTAKEDSNGDIEVDLVPTSAKTTPKKIAKMNAENNKIASNTTAGKEALNNKSKRSDSPVKRSTNKEQSRKSNMTPIYMDLSYVPHQGNSHYASVEFFKRVRARYYVFSGTEPSREVFNALLEAKQTWEDKDLEVTIIPTYDTDTLGYWIAENEDALAKYKIDLSPSASRCTINLQDHETSCSAYRLEF